MTYLEKARSLYEMLGQGQMLEAFEKFYHEDVVMQENAEEPRVGKAVNRKFEEEFMANVQEMHGAGVYSITSDEENGITMVECWMDATFKEGGFRVKMEEVCVQKWEGDQIIKERFYYNKAMYFIFLFMNSTGVISINREVTPLKFIQ